MTTPELRQLRYFLVLAEELSFTRAAARLMIAQQSLSQQITALERSLGVRLFARDTRGTTLTDIGALFVPEARAVTDRAEEAVAVVERARRGEVGSLNLAFLTSVANHLLPPVVRAVREQLPDLRLTTESTTIASLVEGVLGGRYDAAFTRTPLAPGLHSRTLATEPVCAVLPEGHPLAERAELKLADLANEPWVMTPRSSWEPWHRAYDDQFREAGFVPDIVQEEANVQSLLGLVAAGIGVTRLARSARSLRRTGVVFVPLTGAVARTEMVWLSGNTSPALHRLLDVVTELAAKTDLTETG
ncbi:transcriptional regulator, LysR family [Micromonospora coriariae]|uniref:Transcriptional regulator, LysR family n=1 Tax=Micromonospora coriariae TaxID=285665 RepID=A0A1C4XC32_9ACTN|nr:LysR family transcriptional regulator [Micromonospora coriariae]SCF06100.1 transcriptional regulator, LysR family [Micromonospora coriariae]